MKEKFNLFLTSKGITAEVFATKSAEEMANLYNDFNDVARKELEVAIETKATKEDIAKLETSIKDAQAEQMKSLNETLKQYGLQIKKLTEAEKTERAANPDTVKAGLVSNLEKLKALKDGDKGTAEGSQFSFKAVGDMTILGNVSGGNVPVEQRLSGLNVIATRKPRLMDIVGRGTASSNVISWVYQANREGAAGGTTEGTTKNQIDFDLVVASETVKKRTAYIKVSTEMMDDIDFINSEINNELMRLLVKDVETQVYSGDGTGNNLRGIRTVATAFAAGSFALSVDNANLADVLMVANTNIKVADQDGANYVLLNPIDVAKLMLIKTSTTDRRYIDALQMIGNTLTVHGIPIIETTLVTVGEYLIGNFVLSTVYDKGSVTIQVGLDGNDFTKNMRTIIAEWRGLVIVKNNDRTAFIKGVIATDAAALETV